MADFTEFSPTALLDAVKQAGHSAALLTTYNVYFPFFESVVLPRLRAAGVRHVVLLADARCCAEAFADATQRPLLAGHAYTLLPVHAAGAFHPKLLLLAGKRDGQLFVGSHNLTFSGYGLNRELTTRFSMSGGTEEKGIISAAWTFAQEWASRSELPRAELLRMRDAFETLAPWLREPTPPEDNGGFFGARPEGDSLWARVRPRLPTRARRLVVIGPYYDSRLAFLSRLREELGVEEAVVAVDSGMGCMPEDAATRLPWARFVDAQALEVGAQGPVHAKLLWLEAEDGTEWTVAGSANASYAAWLATPDARNAEAVVVRHWPRGKGKASFVEAMNVQALWGAPPLGADAWRALGQRLLTQSLPAEQEAQRAFLAPAMATDTGFTIVSRHLEQHPVQDVTLLEEGAPVPGSAPAFRQEGAACRVEAGGAAAARAMGLELQLEGGRRLLAFVHDAQALISSARTDRQRAFHEALGSLDSAAPDVEGLLRIVEKVIFEEDAPLHSPSTHMRAGSQGTEGEAALLIPTSLVVEGQSHSRDRRAARAISGELGLILDALLAKLGEGLETGVLRRTLDEDARAAMLSEEELVGSDDEAALGLPSEDVDREALARLCEGKLRQLSRRLAKQLKQVATATPGAARQEKALRAVGQTAAVLSILQQLRAQDIRSRQRATAREVDGKRARVPEWVSPQVRQECLQAVVGNLLRGAQSVWEDAVARVAPEGCEEVSRVRGLCCWLALDTGWNRHLFQENVPAEKRPEKAEALGALAHLLQEAQGDAHAVEVARRALLASTPADVADLASAHWAEHLDWARRLLAVTTSTGNVPRRSGVPVPGDFAFSLKEAAPRPLVVKRVEGSKVELVDLRKDENRKHVLVQDVVAVVERSWFGVETAAKDQ